MELLQGQLQSVKGKHAPFLTASVLTATPAMAFSMELAAPFPALPDTLARQRSRCAAMEVSWVICPAAHQTVAPLLG